MPRRRIHQKGPQTTDNVGTVRSELQPEASIEDILSVRALAGHNRPDPRCKLERAIVDMVACVRADRSAPADMADTALPTRTALREHTAAQAPAKHGAFNLRWFTSQTIWGLERTSVKGAQRLVGEGSGLVDGGRSGR